MKKTTTIIVLIFMALCSFSQTDNVIFSASGGFYDDVFQLQMSNSNPQNHIRYTINGNQPTAQSQIYTEPLVLDYSKYSKSDIYTVINSPVNDFYLPDSIQHCIVIRAAVFDENDSCVSKIKTNSYFIGELGCDTHNLPVISICADSLDLFDYNTGIFVPGVYFNPGYPHSTGNYFMTGRDWERVINFEFYKLNNQGINQNVGLRTHGNQQRWRSQKGMKIYARDEYGPKRLNYKFFDEIPVESFKHLVLKPYQATWNGAGCEDFISEHIASALDMETMASRPAVLFINGEYWGVYYVTERSDERYLQDHYGLDPDSVNINIISDWEFSVDHGSAYNFMEFYNWMEQADLSDDTQYEYAETRMDIDNFIDYMIFNLFSANRDWPNKNMRVWQVDNSKFRWIFFDGDGCLASQSFDVFANAVYVGTSTYPSSTRATLFFRRLLENESFKQRFESRFEELTATVFAYANTYPYYEYIKTKLQDEVPNQIFRFGGPPSSYNSWVYYCMSVIKKFLQERPEDILFQLYDFMAIDEILSENISIYPNPANDFIIVGTNNDLFAETRLIASLQIFNMTWRCVLTSTDTEINVSTLPKGVYLVRILTENGNIITKKFIKN